MAESRGIQKRVKGGWNRGNMIVVIILVVCRWDRNRWNRNSEGDRQPKDDRRENQGKDKFMWRGQGRKSG